MISHSPGLNLADAARAVAFMPTLLEAEHVDLETKRADYVGNEEDRTIGAQSDF
jgi:hypothetical protein